MALFKHWDFTNTNLLGGVIDPDNWVVTSGVGFIPLRHTSIDVGMDTGYGLAIETSDTCVGEITNVVDILPNIYNSTVIFKVKFADYSVLTDNVIYVDIRDSNDCLLSIHMLIDVLTGYLYFDDVYSGATRERFDVLDYTHGNVFKIITTSTGIVKVYIDDILLPFPYAINKTNAVPIGNRIYLGALPLSAPQTYTKLYYLSIYDQAIYPPDTLPEVSVSNGTLYFTSKDVRIAGRFKNNEIIPVNSGDTTATFSGNIENVENLLRVTKSTGAKVYLAQVDNTPAAGEYTFTKPNVFVFGDVCSADHVFYADIERMVFQNEIEGVREEVQAEIDGILSSKFTAVPLPSNRVFQQVRKKGAELAALKIMMRHQNLMGKELPGLKNQYKDIIDELIATEVFTLNGAIYKTDNPKVIRISHWQNNHFASKEERRTEWLVK